MGAEQNFDGKMSGWTQWRTGKSEGNHGWGQGENHARERASQVRGDLAGAEGASGVGPGLLQRPQAPPLRSRFRAPLEC